MTKTQELKMQLLKEFGIYDKPKSIDFCREAYKFLVEGDIYKLIGLEANTGMPVFEREVFDNNPKAEAIDLGLPSGTLWADRNVGAKSIEDVGLYLSWGNTDGHVFGTDYDFCEDYENTPGSKLEGDIDLEHDAARVNMGEPWQMPTSEQFQELYDNCNVEFCSVNGYRGMKFTSKINGNSVFFACSGFGNGSSWNNRGSNGNYWSSSFNSARNARNLNFNSGGVNPQNNNNRYNGFAVRPVQLTILTILFLLIYGTDTSAAITRSVSGILQREETQVETLLCQGLGEKPETEHGRPVRRFVLSPLQAVTIEMLRRGLSEEEGDICCRVQGSHSTSSVLQLYSWPVRENIYPRHLFMYQGSWYSLWYWPNKGLLQEGISELAETLLRHEHRHQGLFHAHCEKEALGDRYEESDEDVFPQDKQRQSEDMGRGFGYGLYDMADRDYRHARSETELHHLWLVGGLGRSGSCEVYAPFGRWIRLTDRQPDKSAIQQCLFECVRPVHEESAEMSLLRTVCGRCSHHQRGQRMASVFGAGDTEIPESGIGLRLAHGQATDFGGASWRGVSWLLHQALSDLYLESCFGENDNKDLRVRLLKAEESHQERQLVSGYIQACCLVQSVPQAPYDETDSKIRHIQSRYDQVYRQFFIL